jgi:hypothetical protein
MARRMGLRVEVGPELPDFPSASFTDAVTGNSVFDMSVNTDTQIGYALGASTRMSKSVRLRNSVAIPR